MEATPGRCLAGTQLSTSANNPFPLSHVRSNLTRSLCHGNLRAAALPRRSSTTSALVCQTRSYMFVAWTTEPGSTAGITITESN